jgi:hypothetical protein
MFLGPTRRSGTAANLGVASEGSRSHPKGTPPALPPIRVVGRCAFGGLELGAGVDPDGVRRRWIGTWLGSVVACGSPSVDEADGPRSVRLKIEQLRSDNHQLCCDNGRVEIYTLYGCMLTYTRRTLTTTESRDTGLRLRPS